MEAIPSNPRGDGEPAISFVSKALASKLHVASANKSSLAHCRNDEETYWKLQRLARQNDVLYKHESAVMDGVPLFSLWKYTMPHARLLSLRGCLNSTTTIILSRMEGNLFECDGSKSKPDDGESFHEALHAAKEMGIVEEDEGLDLDGYDAAVKLRALLVFCNADGEVAVPRMEDIPRASIRNITREEIVRAYENGRKKYRLVATARMVDCDVRTAATQKWDASVELRLLSPSDPLYGISGTDASVQFCTDVLGPMTVYSSNPTLVDTAYGLFADIVSIAGESKTS